MEKIIEKLTHGRVAKRFVGGSCSATFFVRKKSEEESVVKIATSDGLNNGCRKLAREVNQIRYLQKKYGKFAKNIIPEILHIWKTDRCVAVEYTLYKGITFADMVRNGKYSNCILVRTLQEIINLVLQCYMLDYKYCKNDFLLTKNVKRIKFRLDYSDRKSKRFFEETKYPIHTINNKNYFNPKLLIGKIEKDKRLLGRLSPKYLGDCIHGDLNLTNLFLCNDGTIKLLDFRGSRSKWDLFYDLGKMIFTSGYDLVRNNEVKGKVLGNGKFIVGPLKKSAPTIKRWQIILSKFEYLLDSNLSFKKIELEEPHWQERLRFCFAIHYLADSACRLVTTSSFNQTLSSYLMGTIFLNRFLQEYTTNTCSKEFYSLKNIYHA